MKNKSFFKFYSTQNIKNIFDIIDKENYLYILNIKSLYVYIVIQKELRKRKIGIVKEDFNLLFLENIHILKKFIIKYYNTKLKLKQNFKSNYCDLILNRNPKIENYNSSKRFIVKNLFKNSAQENFELIFDNILNINHKNYNEFFKNNRKILEISYKSFFSNRHLREIKIQKLNSNLNIKFQKNKFKKVNIFIDDITIKEFELLLSIIASIYKNYPVTFRLKKEFEEFKYTKKEHINFYLVYSSDAIDQILWSRENRFMLSIKNLEDDLKYILDKNISKRLNLLKKDNLSISEKKYVYNKTHYVSKQAKEFIKIFD